MKGILAITICIVMVATLLAIVSPQSFGERNLPRRFGIDEHFPHQDKRNWPKKRTGEYTYINWLEQLYDIDKIRKDISYMKKLSVEWYRTDIRWLDCEPVEGVYDWSKADWASENISSFGDVKMIMTVAGNPTWTNNYTNPDGSKGYQDPNNEYLMGKYEDFVRAITTRYADVVDAWQTGNEPIIFWFDYRGDDYANEHSDMLFAHQQIAYEVIKTGRNGHPPTDPTAYVLMPGFLSKARSRDYQSFEMIDKLCSMEYEKYIDAVNVHSYGYAKKLGDIAFGDTAKWRAGDEWIDSSDLLELMEKYNIDKPIWITEFGNFRYGPSPTRVAEKKHALLLLRNATIASYQWGEMVSYYEMYDYPNSAEKSYIIRHSDHHKTAAFKAYSKLIRYLEGTLSYEDANVPGAQYIGADYSGVVNKLFKRNSENVVCMWSNDSQSQYVTIASDINCSVKETIYEPSGAFGVEDSHSDITRHTFSLPSLGFRIMSFDSEIAGNPPILSITVGSVPYYDAITADDASGNESEVSELINAMPQDVTAPAVITDLAVGEVTEDSITLQWTAPGDDGHTTLESLPLIPQLLQNFPNPFNPDTWIPYQLAEDAFVTISVYNTKGQLIRTLHFDNRKAGMYVTKNRAAYWNGKDSLGQPVASGVYYYFLKAETFAAMRKMVILK